MNVLAAPAQAGNVQRNAGHSLTLDGQADTDYYAVYTTGSHGSVRNYVINVLDTGAPDDGADELAIHGFDNTDPLFNGYVPGTVTKRPTDDIFLLRASKCIDTERAYGISDVTTTGSHGVPTTCDSPSEQAHDPAFVALLHGDGSPDGGLAGYRSRLVGDEVSADLQRVNYDAALNGRLTVFGKGGNDYFAVDDNSAITSLDGGAGNDTFQIGQIFGTKRDEEAGALLPHDVFPVLIATTRGWLSPGTHAPLVAQGGTGNDEFTVYANQAELRLEGDDDNDLFVVRAFALAAVCDTSADLDGDCDFDDISLAANPVTGEFPRDLDNDGLCSTGENGYTGPTRRDNAVNGEPRDGICNNADAHTTTDPAEWEDDTIPLDANGVALPVIGLGFSTNRPLDIRAGGGEDEVSYNVNAPVSVDGGTGFDKLVVLGTEFADDFVITAKAIFGGGLNVRFANVEVVEVDGLEGDDEFYVQSTAFGTAYRVIGGLGSDTINVTGDVTEDIVTRELEGISGSIDHQITSGFDPLYDGLTVDGIDYNLATPDSGKVIIDDEGDEGTSVREGGSPGGGVPQVDSYSVRLAGQPGSNVYVTVSAARSPQEEADNAFLNPEAPGADSLSDGKADTLWLCTGGAPGSGDCDAPTDFKRFKWVAGQFVDEANRALVLEFTPSDWDDRQWVYVFAVDDPRSEGDRVVVVQHSTISQDEEFDAVAVRNVEVSLRDNDTPGVYVTQVKPGTSDEDGRTLVIEGSQFGVDYTGLEDELLVALQKDPGALTITVKLVLDAESQQAISLSSSDARWVQQTVGLSTSYLISFNGANWFMPVRVKVTARDDARREDPQSAQISFVRDASTVDPLGRYVFPNLRSGTGLTEVEVIDDETAGAVIVESGTGTIVGKCGNAGCTLPGDSDDYTIRLTKRPLGDVSAAVLTDGMVDVVSIGGVPVGPRRLPRDRRPDPDAPVPRQPQRGGDHDHARERLRARLVHRRRLRGRRPDPARRGGRGGRDDPERHRRHARR